MKKSLCGIWQMRRVDSPQWYDAAVPGSCMETLLQNGLIPDPYYRQNEEIVRDQFDYDYQYRSCFWVTEEELCQERIELVFEGLDTLADVTINGNLILQADNMHRIWRIPIKQILNVGNNEMSVYFHSPNRYIAEKIAKADVNFPACGCMAGNNYIRKAHSMFGWDWGPQLPDCGIWRDVYLEIRTGAYIADIYPTQRHESDTVTVQVDVELGAMQLQRDYEIQLALTAPDGQMIEKRAPASEQNTLSVCVNNPLLWWPNGLGEHPLYHLQVTLLLEGQPVDERQMRIGLRQIELCQQVDSDGKGAEFAFAVNGCKFFATGANYIPEDSFLSRITAERSRKLVQDCAWANYNMIRVWGGGYYPSDAFYDACDEYGILVWQDLMFACNVYELEPAFEETITAEVIDNVRRLRHHASLALWCGNNEMEWGWQEWFPILTPSVARRNDYTVMFEYLLRKLVNQYDPATQYKASSPSSNYQMMGFATTNDHLPNCYYAGDTHFYDVWLNRAPLEEYRAHRFRFLSEFSFQSLPSLKTLSPLMLPEDLDMNSPVMDARQKNDRGNGLILHYLADHYRIPKDFESMIYVTQLMQSYAVPYAIEHMRRNRPYSMGTLYWQLNDVWPGISWSSVDYYGRYKALHYAVRRAYAPFTASILDEGMRMQVWVENETREIKEYHLVCQLKNMANEILFEKELDGRANPFTATAVVDEDFTNMVDTRKRECYFCFALYEKDVLIHTDVAFFVKHKHLALPEVHIDVRVEETPDAFVLMCNSDRFACRVRLELENLDAVFSDNYFCLTGDERIITVRKQDISATVSAQQLLEQLQLRSLRDTYS